MNIVIRVDASLQMGSGHVVRCLTLAEGLRNRKFNVSFLSQRLPGHFFAQFAARGFSVGSLPALEYDGCVPERDSAVPHAGWLGVDWQHDAGHAAEVLSAVNRPADWLIVDHYALDKRWEDAMRPYANHIMVIDDLANRPHNCDLLLDQICTEDHLRYEGLLPSRCRKLFGSKFALLRPEFPAARAHPDFPAEFVDNNVAHVFFGTSDKAGHTMRFSRLLLEQFPSLHLKIAVGGSFAHQDRLADMALQFGGRVAWQQGVTDMAAHMRDCSIAVGTPGMSTWERACMGLPAAHLTNAASQVDILLSLQESGFCELLGHVESITDEEFVTGMAHFLGDRTRLTRMRQMGIESVDGKGVERVIGELTAESQ